MTFAIHCTIEKRITDHLDFEFPLLVNSLSGDAYTHILFNQD
jgi:hypothetical protein